MSFLVDELHDYNISYGYDDVTIKPSPSNIDSRDDVDISVRLGENLKLDIPIIASPMKGIVGTEIIKRLDILGAMGILHRFHNSFYVWDMEVRELKLNCENWGASISLGSDNYKYLLDLGAKIICIDVANGYMESLLKFVYDIRNVIDKSNYNTLLMAGNVAEREGSHDLRLAGADLVRVGIGTGNLCTTTKVTGIGIKPISALASCVSFNEDIKLVADGGIRSSGDGMKALLAGADVLMLGSLFAQCLESSHNGIIYGMASRKLQEEYYHSVKSVEGIEKEAEKKVPVKDFISEFVYGMKSACTYLNISKLEGVVMHENFVRV